MPDKRRRRWVAHDVYFLDRPLGTALYDRFGAAGVALWFGFIAAAKKHHIEGRITYASDAEALTLFGLPGMDLTDHDGQSFELDDFWRLLGDHKVTRRTSRGRATQVLCTHWAEWQDPKRTRASGQRPPRSEGETTDTMHRDTPEHEREVPPDLDLDLDLDLDPDVTPLPPPSGGDPDAKDKPLNPRAAGTSPRANGQRARQHDAATSRGRTLAAGTDRTDALEAIHREYANAPDLAETAIRAYDEAIGGPT